MAKRKIDEFSSGNYSVKVYYDPEYSEYVARLYEFGKLYEPADAFDNDKESIIGTAKSMLKFAVAKSAKKNPRKSTSGNETAANELFLFIQNEGRLYHQMTEPILKSLAMKKRRGTYDHTKALKAWSNLAAAGAKLYNVDYGSGKPSLAGFDVATRLLTADKLQDYYEDMIQPENLAGQRGFKTVTARENPKVTYNILTSETRTGNKKLFITLFDKTEAYAIVGKLNRINPHLFIWIDEK